MDGISITLNADTLTIITTTQMNELTFEPFDANEDNASLWTFEYDLLVFIVCMISFVILVIL